MNIVDTDHLNINQPWIVLLFIVVWVHSISIIHRHRSGKIAIRVPISGTVTIFVKWISSSIIVDVKISVPSSNLVSLGRDQRCLDHSSHEFSLLFPSECFVCWPNMEYRENLPPNTFRFHYQIRWSIEMKMKGIFERSFIRLCWSINEDFSVSSLFSTLTFQLDWGENFYSSNQIPFDFVLAALFFLSLDLMTNDRSSMFFSDVTLLLFWRSFVPVWTTPINWCSTMCCSSSSSLPSPVYWCEYDEKWTWNWSFGERFEQMIKPIQRWWSKTNFSPTSLLDLQSFDLKKFLLWDGGEEERC